MEVFLIVASLVAGRRDLHGRRHGNVHHVHIQRKFGRAHPRCCRPTPYIDGLSIDGLIGLGAWVERGARRAGFGGSWPEARLFRALKGERLGGSAGRAGSAVLVWRGAGCWAMRGARRE